MTLSHVFCSRISRYHCSRAPRLRLPHEGDEQAPVNISDEYCVKSLCRILGVEFKECAHDDIEQISNITKCLGSRQLLFLVRELLSEM